MSTFVGKFPPFKTDSNGNILVSLTGGGSPTFDTITLTGAALSQHPVTANSGSAYTIDQANGAQFDITLTAATPVLTLQAVNAGKTQTLNVTLIQDGTGGRAPTWANVTWAAGVAPTIASAIAARTYLEFVSDGVTWTGYAVPASTGSGAQVLATSATITTPAITGGSYDGGIIGAVTPVKASGYSPVNTQTGTTFAPALINNGSFVTLSNGSAITVTIPANASVAFPIGASIDFASLGSGIVTFAITTDTLVSKGAKVTLTGQYSVGNIKKIATTTWLLSGDLA